MVYDGRTLSCKPDGNAAVHPKSSVGGELTAAVFP